MVNKCAVFGCKRCYESEEPQHEDYHAFYFPLDERKSHLLPAWEKFVCRDGWKPSANSVICEFHFEDRLIRKGKRWTLKWKLNPMPTILTDEMKAMPQSVQPTPGAPPRKPQAKHTYQEDEINAFLSQDIIGDFFELNCTHAPPGFYCTKSDNSIVFFNLTYVDGFPVIFGGRFLVSLREVTNSERIIRCRSLIRQTLTSGKKILVLTNHLLIFLLFLLCLVSMKLKLLNRLLIRVAKKFPLQLRVTSPKNWKKGLIATVVNCYLLQVQWTWQKTITSTFFLVADSLSICKIG